MTVPCFIFNWSTVSSMEMTVPSWHCNNIVVLCPHQSKLTVSCLHLKLVQPVGKVKTVPSWHFNCFTVSASIETDCACIFSF